MKKQAKRRAKHVNSLIRSVWASLESHLDYVHKKGVPPPESNKFHRKCVVEYSKMIVKLTRLY